MLMEKPTWFVGEIKKSQCKICGCDPFEEFINAILFKMAKDFVTNCLLCDFNGRLLNVDGLISHPFIQNAISTCENEDQLISISSTINDNPFGDFWVSESHLFTTTCKKWKAKIRKSIKTKGKDMPAV